MTSKTERWTLAEVGGSTEKGVYDNPSFVGAPKLARLASYSTPEWDTDTDPTADWQGVP